MECIKIEPTIALEESLMHVFQLKPDPDIFFHHFLDSKIMDNIRNIFETCLENLTEFYFKVIKFLILYDGQDDIRSILRRSIQCYRIWYESVLEKFPGDYEPPAEYGFYATTYLQPQINLSYKQIHQSLLSLNEKVKIFDVAWKKKLIMDYRCLDNSLIGIMESFDGFVYNNRIGRHQVDRLPTKIMINGKEQLDSVTHSIKSVFPDVYIALFK